jgi:hypothetical protein
MGSSAPSTSTQYVKSETSNLPEYAKPYFMDLMGAAKGYTLGNTNEAPIYGGQRIAPFTQQQQQVQQNILGQQTPGQFGMASNLAGAAGLGSLMGGNYQPGQFNAQQVGVNPLNYFQMNAPGQFGQEQAQQYMSPFIQSALEPQMREAVFSAKRGQLTEDLGAARQGTYGGSRQLLAGMERERNLGQQLGDIQARGMQSAFENAQQQFERDRAAQMGAGQENLRAALGVQQLGTESGLRADMANQQFGLDAQRLGEQSRQFASQQGLAGLAQAGQMGQTLANIGQVQQQGDLARLNQQQQTAAQEQALQQQLYDQQYQDFLRQQNYPLEMLQQYSSLLRGVPVAPNTTSTTTMPNPSLASQIMGTGLGALGAYKALA